MTRPKYRHDQSYVERRVQPAAHWWKSATVHVILTAAVVATITAAVQCPVLHSRAFIFDDQDYVGDNALVQNPSWNSVSRFFSEILEPSSVGGYYQPLSMISLMTDHALGGCAERPTAFHATSLVLHAANVAMIFLILLSLFSNRPAAVIGALIFGLHPTTVESVAWIAERKTVLATFFAFASIGAYLGYVRMSQIATASVGSTRIARWGTCLLSVLLFAAALLSKPIVTPLPVLLLLLDIWPLRRISLHAVLEKTPYFLLAAGSAAITVVSQSRTANLSEPMAMASAKIPMLVCHNVVTYLGKFVWPVSLSAFDAFPMPFTLAEPTIRAALIITPLLLLVLIVSLRWTRAWLVGGLFFFIALVPSLGIMGFSNVITADRHLYFPMLGLILPIAWLIARIGSSPRARPAMRVVVLVCLACESALTRRYIPTWKDSETAFRHMTERAPQAAYPWHSLAGVLRQQGRAAEAQRAADRAMVAFQRAIDADNNPVAHNNLAVLLATQGRFDEALAHLREAVRGKPNWAVGYNTLAGALIQHGDFAAAADAYRHAIELRPGYALAHYNYGRLLLGQHDAAQAAVQLGEAVRIIPTDSMFHSHLSMAYAELRQLDRAGNEAQLALDLATNEAQSRLAKAIQKQLAIRQRP